MSTGGEGHGWRMRRELRDGSDGWEWPARRGGQVCFFDGEWKASLARGGPVRKGLAEGHSLGCGIGQRDVNDVECLEFLRWALPHLGLRWPGFRKVRRQVCRRIQQRMCELGLPDLHSYQGLLARQPDEWRALADCCVVTISRFYRDRGVYEGLAERVLPALAERAALAGQRRLRVWSAGCASGEEPYSLALIWYLRVARRFPGLALELFATDSQRDLLERARRACYRHSSLRELPPGWVEEGFDRSGDQWCLKQRCRRGVRLLRRDVTEGPPDGIFDLVLCRNLVFTYFTLGRQQVFLQSLMPHLAAGAALVVGSHETLPAQVRELTSWAEVPCVWRYDPAVA